MRRRPPDRRAAHGGVGRPGAGQRASRGRRSGRGATGDAGRVADERLAFFTLRLTNGCGEGKHTHTTSLPHQAYSYRNPDNLRLHVLLPAA